MAQLADFPTDEEINRVVERWVKSPNGGENSPTVKGMGRRSATQPVRQIREAGGMQVVFRPWRHVLGLARAELQRTLDVGAAQATGPRTGQVVVMRGYQHHLGRRHIEHACHAQISGRVW